MTTAKIVEDSVCFSSNNSINDAKNGRNDNVTKLLSMLLNLRSRSYTPGMLLRISWRCESRIAIIIGRNLSWKNFRWRSRIKGQGSRTDQSWWEDDTCRSAKYYRRKISLLSRTGWQRYKWQGHSLGSGHPRRRWGYRVVKKGNCVSWETTIEIVQRR